jgi:tryptophan synthase beta chain
MSEQSKFLLADSQIPSAWVNVLPSLKEPLAPPLNPRTREPLAPQDLLPIFPMELIQQEFSPLPEIDIPGEVMDIYRLWRATPLYRARRLEKALDTPAHIYYKYEGTSPAGSHKPNTAVAQAYYNKRAGMGGWLPKPERGSGAAHSRSPASSSAWSARSTWCGAATIKSPTAA